MPETDVIPEDEEVYVSNDPATNAQPRGALEFHGPPGPLLAALAAAQGAFGTVGRNQTGQTGHRKFGYADLENFVEATRPDLAKHGLGVLQGVATDEKDRLVITTCLGHKSGSSVTSTVRLKSGETTTKDGVQWCGALTTYWRRFQYRSLLCLADGEDLDAPDAPRAAAPKAETNGAKGVEVLVIPKEEPNDLQIGYLENLGAKKQSDGSWLATVPRKRAVEMAERINWAEVKKPDEAARFQTAGKPNGKPQRGTPQKVK